MVLCRTFGLTSGLKVGYSLVREVSSKNEFWNVLELGQSSSFDLTCRRQGIRFCHLIGTITVICTVILAELISLVTLRQKKQQRKGIIKKRLQNDYFIAPA